MTDEEVLAEVEHLRAQDDARDLPVNRYRDDPVGFAQECILWGPDEGLTEEQQGILRNLVVHGRVVVKGPHGLGKTTINALAILWFAYTRDGEDWKVVTTASAWRQLTVYLWPEVHKWARRVREDVTGRPQLLAGTELLDLNIKLTTGQASAVASNDPAKIEGAHADQILYIFDEAKTVPEETFDAAEGAFSTGHAYGLAQSTPGQPQGRFYDLCRRKPGTEDWYPINVTKEQCIASGRMNPDWAEKRRRQWGEKNPVYRNRVLGEFASQGTQVVIPLEWVEAAQLRWAEWRQRDLLPPFTCVGVDVGGGGEDPSMLAIRHALVISEIRRFPSPDEMELTGATVGILRKHGGEGYAAVDVIGIGAGVVSRLRELGYEVLAFNASEHTDAMDLSGELHYANKRSAAWWNMREMLNPASGLDVCLPPDTDEVDLTAELTAPTWRLVSGGRILIESKDDLRKSGRLGHSTDAADAVIQAFYVEPLVADDEYVYWQDDSPGISPY